MNDSEMALVKRDLIRELRQEFRVQAHGLEHRTMHLVLDKTLEVLEERYNMDYNLAGVE